jgi:hypothetical protein
MTEFVFVSGAGPDCAPGYVTSGLDVHVRACLDRNDDQEWWQSADVLYHERVVTVAQVLQRLREYPGCAVCAGTTAAGWLILAVRQGRTLSTLCTRADATPGVHQCALIGSALHALLVAGLEISSARTLTVSGRPVVRLSSSSELSSAGL